MLREVNVGDCLFAKQALLLSPWTEVDSAEFRSKLAHMANGHLLHEHRFVRNSSSPYSTSCVSRYTEGTGPCLLLGVAVCAIVIA